MISGQWLVVSVYGGGHTVNCLKFDESASLENSTTNSIPAGARPATCLQGAILGRARAGIALPPVAVGRSPACPPRRLQRQMPAVSAPPYPRARL